MGQSRLREPGGHAAALLDWYDRCARDLPWRVGPAERACGVRPDPYHVWLSEIMLQQTTVRSAWRYFEEFIDRWPTIGDLAAAADNDVMAAWAGLGYYARARNLLKTARIVAQSRGGRFPEKESELRKLPGVGTYTAAAITAIAFDRPAAVVDGNVKRVLARLDGLRTLSTTDHDFRERARQLTPTSRPGDYVQAVMDLGATVCRPRAPRCADCPWESCCLARVSGSPESYPGRVSRLPKPVHRCLAYVAVRADGAVLLERRPESGLLGGMLGWPGSDWAAPDEPHAPPCDAKWETVDGEVRHVLTHLDLRLTVQVAQVAGDCRPCKGDFVERARFEPRHLPSVMQKVWRVAEKTLNK